MPTAYAAFDARVRSLGRLPRRARPRTTPPDIERPGLGDALAGLRLGRTFRGLGKHDAPDDPAGPADGRRRLRGRGLRDRRRCGRRSPGAASSYCALGPWSAGTAAVLLARLGGQRRRRGRRDGLRPGRPGRARRGAGGGGAGGGCRDPDAAPRSRRSRRATGGRPASSLAVGEEIDGPRRRLRRSTRSGRSTGLVDPSRSGRASAGEPATSGRPGVVAKVNLALAAPARASRPPADDARSAAPRPDRRRARASTPWSGPSTPRSTAGFATSRSSRRRSRRSSTRRSSMARRTRHARHERHRPVRAVPRCATATGTTPRETLRRPRHRAALETVRAGHRQRSSPRGRS